MRNTIIECEATEYNVVPPKENEFNGFCINENSLIISFCKKDETVIMQSEISIEDAIFLANAILLHRK